MLTEKFLTYLRKERNYSDKTVESYRNDILSFASFLEETRQKSLIEADTRDIRRWIVWLSSRGMQPRSVNRKLTALRSFYKFLFRISQIHVNPVAGLKGMKIPKHHSVPFSETEMHRLFDRMDFGNDFKGLRDKAVLKTFYDTGIRRAELIGLLIRDIDFSSNTLKVLGKGNKERLIPLLPDLTDTLKEYHRVRTEKFDNPLPGDPFFLTDSGKKLYEMFVYRLINRYISLVSTKEKKSPHMLRHSFATHMLNKGAELNAIKELLGHASLAATQHYLHAGLAELKDVYRQAHPRSRKKS